jgi:hypothetical protein
MLPRAGFNSLIPRVSAQLSSLSNDCAMMLMLPFLFSVGSALSSLLLSLPPFPLLFEQGTSGGILTG